MSDQHPIQKIVDEQKKEAEALVAVAAAAEKRSLELAARVKDAWPKALKIIRLEVQSANAVFETNNLAERFALASLPEPDRGHLAHATLKLEHPSKGTLVTCDITVSATDGRLVARHRTRTPSRQGSGHRDFIAQDINKTDWADFLGSLYRSTI